MARPTEVEGSKMVSVRLPAAQLRRLERALKKRRRAGTDDGTLQTRSRLLRVVIGHGLDALDALETDPTDGTSEKGSE